jgi:hypothetical protein
MVKDFCRNLNSRGCNRVYSCSGITSCKRRPSTSAALKHRSPAATESRSHVCPVVRTALLIEEYALRPATATSWAAPLLCERAAIPHSSRNPYPLAPLLAGTSEKMEANGNYPPLSTWTAGWRVHRQTRSDQPAGAYGSFFICPSDADEIVGQRRDRGPHHRVFHPRRETIRKAIEHAPGRAMQTQ